MWALLFERFTVNMADNVDTQMPSKLECRCGNPYIKVMKWNKVILILPMTIFTGVYIYKISLFHRQWQIWTS